jgi:hypothetical protein
VDESSKEEGKSGNSWRLTRDSQVDQHPKPGVRANMFIACELSQIPRSGFVHWSSLFRALMQAGTDVICFEALADSMPSQAIIGNIAFDCAAECLAIQRARLRKAIDVMLGCDKGQQHGIDHLPKCLSYFSMIYDRVKSFCSDNDPNGGTSDAAAHAKAHSLNSKVGTEALKDLQEQIAAMEERSTVSRMDSNYLAGYSRTFLWFYLVPSMLGSGLYKMRWKMSPALAGSDHEI